MLHANFRHTYIKTLSVFWNSKLTGCPIFYLATLRGGFLGREQFPVPLKSQWMHLFMKWTSWATQSGPECLQMKNNSTLCWWWCLERGSPFACLPLLANKVCLGKRLSRVNRAPTLAPTCLGCHSNSNVYLQCDLWLINLHLLPGMINTCSAYLPDWSEWVRTQRKTKATNTMPSI